MRHFNLLLGQEIRGPLSEDEIRPMIASGTVTADTPCAPVGAQSWEPLARHFTFGKGLQVLRSKPVSTNAEEKLAASRIDPDTRVRLITYGLADAVTIEALTQVQAEQAIALKENAIRGEIRLHRIVAGAALAIGLLLGTETGLSENVASAQLGRLVGFFIKEQGNAKDSLHMLRGTIREEADIRQRAKASQLQETKNKPAGK